MALGDIDNNRTFMMQVDLIQENWRIYSNVNEYEFRCFTSEPILSNDKCRKWQQTAD